MDGQRLHAHILQHACHLHDTNTAVVPAESGLDRNRQIRSLDNGGGYGFHLWKITQDAGTTVLAYDLS